MAKNILFRVDASKNIGLGHITRCIALAIRFKAKSYNIYFALKEQMGIKIVKENNFKIMEASKFNFDYNSWIQNIVDDKNIDIFIGDVRDGLSQQIIKDLKSKNILTVAIDEPSDYAKECDLVFYPPHARIDILKYKCKVYQGIEYIILKDEFYKKYEKQNNNIPNILVMLGGTDTYNLTLKSIKHLLSLNLKINICVIISKSHKDYNKISTMSNDLTIYSDIKNMAEFLTIIDFAIVSFGTSAYELLAMQIPAIHICLDEDHYKASRWFEKNNYAKRYKKEEIDNINFDIIDMNNFDTINITEYEIVSVIQEQL